MCVIGKTSLLCGLLGELNLQAGKVFMGGKVAYHQQIPWILNTTILENITLSDGVSSKDYDEDRLNEVLKACALDVDIAQLASGVYTEIGMK